MATASSETEAVDGSMSADIAHITGRNNGLGYPGMICDIMPWPTEISLDACAS